MSFRMSKEKPFDAFSVDSNLNVFDSNYILQTSQTKQTEGVKCSEKNYDLFVSKIWPTIIEGTACNSAVFRFGKHVMKSVEIHVKIEPMI